MSRSTATRAQVILLLATFVLMAVMAPAASAAVRTTLSGSNEVPGPGDPDGSGQASISIKRGKGEICWSIQVQDIALPASAAHIHIGDATVAGPVVVALSPPDETGHASGCRVVGKQAAKEIAEDLANHYVNVHNPEYPAGALRGQLG